MYIHKEGGKPDLLSNRLLVIIANKTQIMYNIAANL